MNENMNIQIIKWFHILRHNRWLQIAAFAIFALVLATIVNPDHTSPQNLHMDTELSGIDTFIPANHVLVPIDVHNFESLDSVFGRYGIADLYVPGQLEPLIKGIKLLRSPKNPRQFAALIDENHSQRIVKASSSPLQVILQNPDHNAKSSLKTISQKRRIIYEN